MGAPSKRQAGHTTFLDDYINQIGPWLREIDIFIKSSDFPISIHEVSIILSISKDEIKTIMEEEGIKKIGKQNFFKIMEKGSSRICLLYKREVLRGSPFVYSIDDVCYIYGLCREKVEAAYHSLGIKEATSFTLPQLFSQIRID